LPTLYVHDPFQSIRRTFGLILFSPQDRSLVDLYSPQTSFPHDEEGLMVEQQQFCFLVLVRFSLNEAIQFILEADPKASAIQLPCHGLISWNP